MTEIEIVRQMMRPSIAFDAGMASAHGRAVGERFLACTSGDALEV